MGRNVAVDDDVKTLMMDFSKSFASYLKYKKRGKKDRRAIESANTILRAFLYIIDEFHLELGKHISEMTISVGGEEKKAKITNVMNASHLGHPSHSIQAQGTEDTTKWNECLSPELFAILHK